MWLHHPLVLASAGLAALWMWRRLRARALDMAGQTVLVTGASSGLGRAIATVAHKAGARVILLARSLDKLAEVAEELKAADPQGPPPVYRFLDLADPQTPFGDVVRECLKEAGATTLDLLVNNAGLSVRAAAADTSMDVHRRLMEVNYFGPIALTQACLPLLAPSGRILVISSVQGRIAIPHRSAYAASKHALQAYFDSLRAEVDIGVSVASPGYIATDLSRNALTGSGTEYGRLDASTSGGLSPTVAATALLTRCLEGESDILLADTKSRMAILLRALLPRVYHWLMKKRA